LSIANAFLNTPKSYRPYLDRVVQLRLFENRENLRVLGLLNNANDHQTYQWIAEMSKKVLEPQEASSVDFPLEPPASASDIITVKLEKMETCAWSMPHSSDFQALYSDQGFSGRILSVRNGGTVYLLQKGNG